MIKVSGNSLRLTRLDEDGNPTGEPVEVAGPTHITLAEDDVLAVDYDIYDNSITLDVSMDAVDPAALLVLLTGEPWRADPTHVGLGAIAKYDYAVDLPLFNDRITRCYELSALGITRSLSGLSGTGVPEGAPLPVALVHGSWTGPDSDNRIDHAWLLLDGGYVWEPILGVICDREKFYAYANAQDHATYTPREVAASLARYGHYGPWRPTMEGDD